MPRFRFHHHGSPDSYDTALISAWTAFCDLHHISPAPRRPSGDAALDAWNASIDYRERPLAQMTTVRLPAPLGRLRPGRYRYLAVKYWRKNPTRLWWLGHVWDELRDDWLGR
ncbi:hypothetical protein MHW47_00235 [Streptomyces sp. OfavH-34-F]|uniref:hypothetical protein n=1 Tax=Streptomyces sp. OfavH-34-F TaxID=2917760 RepID=UPI001EF18112|nr:hypothetical protein [Streptomyces sp. OfavH-34-F]MCG7522883.1 hypothetical protein [Streptomyces sp. OfavH-34-F]